MTDLSQVDINITDRQKVFESIGFGRTDQLLSTSLHGVFHSGATGLSPTSKELLGPVFVTRPQLNLTEDNIRPRPNLLPLLNTSNLSSERYIRCMLDPRLMEGTSQVASGNKHIIGSSFLNNKFAFIPTLSNDLTSLSGFPDKILPSYSSNPGALKEIYSHVDGSIEIYDERDINMVVRNSFDSLSFNIIDTWCEYASDVYMGRTVPYPDLVIENEIDYMTRIYVPILKRDGLTLARMACTGVSYPIVSPIGTYFNRAEGDPYQSSPQQHNFRFKSLGVIYNTNVVVRDFNDVVAIFNPLMHPSNRESYMSVIKPGLYRYFKGEGYPHIDMETKRFSWYIEDERYEKILTDAYHDKSLSKTPLADLKELSGAPVSVNIPVDITVLDNK